MQSLVSCQASSDAIVLSPHARHVSITTTSFAARSGKGPASTSRSCCLAMPWKEEQRPVPGQQTLWSSTPSEGPPVAPAIKGASSRAEESPRFIQSSLLGAFKQDFPGHLQRSFASDDLSLVDDGGHKKAPELAAAPMQPSECKGCAAPQHVQGACCVRRIGARDGLGRPEESARNPRP